MSETFRCKICPFECGVDRSLRFGVCGLPDKILVSHIQRHFYEEPFISGSGCYTGEASDRAGGAGVASGSGGSVMADGSVMAGGAAMAGGAGVTGGSGGSGAIFFTGCNAKCVFCQNYKISQKEEWLKRDKREVSNEELFEICQGLIAEGVHNINFVSPTPYTHLLVDFLRSYKSHLGVPVIWNSNGYEKSSTIRELDGLVDVYLPDLKYFDSDLAVQFSSMPRYFEFASEAVAEMLRQVGWPEIGEDGFIKRGLVIRHLVLPGQLEDSKKVLRWIRDKFATKAFVALMSQYYPTYKACGIAEIDRSLSKNEHEEIIRYFEELGFEDGLVQDLESADSSYTPDFK